MMYKEGELRRLQLAQLDILRDIDRVCRDNDITYFLDSGTVLGAVRHAGFIPWDDDIDIGIPRSEYQRFLDIAPQALGSSYEVADPSSCANIAGMFAKVWKKGTKFTTKETREAGVSQGIFVDVFPYDYLHSNPVIARQQIRQCRLWQSVSYLYHAKSITVPHSGALSALERGGCVVAHYAIRLFFSPGRIRKNFLLWALKGNDSPGNELLNMSWITTPFPQEVLVPCQSLEFEGYSFRGPAQAQSYLEVAYGSSWRELPPEHERRNHAPLELSFGE